MNDYYVYEHIRLDNNTAFYVGKGRGKRSDCKKRNAHHDRIADKHGMKVNIVAANLSEDEAYKIERETIAYYVFILGYGIDIIGYRNGKHEIGHLTNSTFGGDGSYGMVHSEEWCLQHSLDMTGENNPAYGVNYWESFSEEKKQELLKGLSERASGKNNPMYGVSPKERMDEETYKNWRKNIKLRMQGENNPNYGNDTLHNKVKDDPELRIKYYSRPGAQNGRAREIDLFDLNHTFISRFDTIGDCAEYIKEKLNLKSKVDGIRSNISKAAKSNKPYRCFYFKLY